MKSSTETEINANALNTAGYMLLKEGRVKDAIAVFEHNLSNFPENANIYDSLGEAYAEANELKKAAEIFRMAIEKNPQNANAIEILRHLPSQ